MATIVQDSPPAEPRGRHLGPAPSISRALCWVGAIDHVGLSRSELTRALAGPILLLVVAAVAAVSGTIFAHDLLGLTLGTATVVGCGWGFVVFCLDRAIVVSLGGLVGRRRLVIGALRLAMAALIGWVVAEPLVLRIFTTEIQAELVAFGRAEQEEAARRIARDPRYGDDVLAQAAGLVEIMRSQAAATGPDPAEINADPEVQRLQAVVDAAEEARRAQEVKVECESDGSCGTGQAGDGPEWARKLAELQRLEGAAVDARQQLVDARREAERRSGDVRNAAAGAASQQLGAAIADHADRLEQRKAADEASARAISGQTGLGARMDALGRLRHARPSINTEYWMITALLVLVDTSAVALKLMQRPSTQDETADLDRAASLERRQAIIRHANEELEIDLVEDKVLRASHREVFREHQEQQNRTFLDAVRARESTRGETGESPMLTQADAELAGRLARRSWAGELPAADG